MKKFGQWGLVLLAAFVIMNVAACAKGPTNEEAVKAIQNMSMFTSGVEKYILKSPIVVVDIGGRNKDGSWPVKVRFTASYQMADGKEMPPVEKTSTYNVYRNKDSAGTITWTAK